jgi:two-component system LytT family sensor kinase
MTATSSRTLRFGLRGWAAFAAVTTLVGLYNFALVATARIGAGSPVPPKHDLVSQAAGIAANAAARASSVALKHDLVHQMTGAYAFLAILPLLFRLTARFPLDGSRWARHVPVHLAGLAALGACHTVLMLVSRSALFPLLGWGPYRPGNLRYRFLAEYPIQAMAYALAVAVVTAIAHAQRSRERQLHASQLERQLADARLAALQMQLQPHFLFNALNLVSSCLR